MSVLLQQAYAYAGDHLPELIEAVKQHLWLVAVALGIGIVICIPLGIWTSRSRWAALTVVNLFNGLRVIPSLAVLFLAIPYLRAFHKSFG
jgi:osmoprotectant transport system permease protein